MFVAPTSRRRAPLASRISPNPESAADLDQFASGNDHFGFSPGKVAYDQNERCGAVVNYRRGFAPTKEGETAFEIPGAASAGAGSEIVLEIVVGRSDFGDGADRIGSKWRAAEIGVNEDSRAVNHRLKATLAETGYVRFEIAHDLPEAWDRFAAAQQSKFLPDELNHEWTWQVGGTERLENFPNRGDGAASGFHLGIGSDAFMTVRY